MKIHSIFESISGEAGYFPQGSWVTFIRFHGCSLDCKWCDTPQAKGKDTKYHEYSVADIIGKIHAKRVLITGGEPLVQRTELIRLITALHEYGHIVQVETNGHHALPVIDTGSVHWVMDYKCPSSGMHRKMQELDFLADNIHEIQTTAPWSTVHIKWVLASLEDVYFASDRIKGLRDIIAHPFLGPHIISPINANGAWLKTIIRQLMYMNQSFDNIIFSVQLHKIVEMP